MEKQTSHTEKPPACTMESLPMELPSANLSERLSCMEEQSLLAEDLSSKTQLEVSAHMCMHLESQLGHEKGAIF